jgi:hypothetical protein
MIRIMPTPPFDEYPFTLGRDPLRRGLILALPGVVVTTITLTLDALGVVGGLATGITEIVGGILLLWGCIELLLLWKHTRYARTRSWPIQRITLHDWGMTAALADANYSTQLRDLQTTITPDVPATGVFPLARYNRGLLDLGPVLELTADMDPEVWTDQKDYVFS